MSEAGKAVFLSYASQDAEAARRICEALRSGGVEVWFDADGGLEHGDEWDAKIRKQIKECVLFIPVISANTQARLEGYFRLEWELAAQRAMSIASGVPFILPVVIDDTREPDALVPDRFRTVQWTKLPGGVVTPEVKARYLKLWSHRTGVLKAAEMEPGRPRPGERGEGATSPAQAIVGRRIPTAAWITAGVAVATIVGFITLRPKPSVDAVTRPPAAEKPTPTLSEARKLVLQARALVDDDWLAVRENFRNADDLCERATKLDPLDGEAWATWARVSALLIDRDYDTSRTRRDAARSRAERALQLAPDSTEAGLAMALVLAQNDSVSDANQRLRALLQRSPMDWRVARALAFTYSPARKPGSPEGSELRLHHPSFGGRDPRPLLDEARSMHDTKRQLARCEALMEQANALGPCWEGYAMGLAYQIYSVCDLDAAERLALALPPRLLQEDVFAVLVAKLWIFRGDGEKARVALARVPRDFIEDRWYFQPTSSLVGEAYLLSGKRAAAQEQWKQALAVTEKRLSAEPSHKTLLVCKALILAKLGRKEEAWQTWSLARELGSINHSAVFEAQIRLASGDGESAIQRIVRTMGSVEEQHLLGLNLLRLEPAFAPIRSDPRIAEIITKTEAMVARLRRRPDTPGAKSVGAAEAAEPDTKSVAVLPFVNQSADKENEYFSDGIAEELLTTLQKIPGLRVAARTSAWSFKGKNATAQEVGTQLGMAHLVEGSVQKSGNRVKITARLSRAATNEEIWSKSFGPLELTDVFATQSEIALAIVAELRGRLTGEAAAAARTEIQAQVQAANKGGTKNAEAHQLYLQGKYFLNQFTDDEVKRAVEYLQRALALDANFALAWSALADAHNYLGGYSARPEDVSIGFDAARKAAQRALSLEPDLAGALRVLAESKMNRDFDWKGAKPLLDRAQQLAPLDPEVLFSAATFAGSTGRPDLAAARLRQAVNLDPVNPLFRINLGGVLSNLGRFREAEVEYQRAIELSPKAPWTFSGLALCYAMQGRFAEAEPVARQEVVEWTRLTALAVIQWGKGARAEADATLEKIIADSAGVAAYQIAGIYGFRRENDRAFDWLERALRQRDPGLVITKTDLWFRPLHSDPRWPAFLRKLGLHDEQLR